MNPTQQFSPLESITCGPWGTGIAFSSADSGATGNLAAALIEATADTLKLIDCGKYPDPDREALLASAIRGALHAQHVDAAERRSDSPCCPGSAVMSAKSASAPRPRDEPLATIKLSSGYVIRHDARPVDLACDIGLWVHNARRLLTIAAEECNSERDQVPILDVQSMIYAAAGMLDFVEGPASAIEAHHLRACAQADC